MKLCKQLLSNSCRVVRAAGEHVLAGPARSFSDYSLLITLGRFSKALRHEQERLNSIDTAIVNKGSVLRIDLLNSAILQHE